MGWSELAALFRFDVSPLEIVVRGTAMYWFLFLLFRFVLRRDTGSIAITDILLLVLIADASQNAMAGSYQTVAGGCLLVATIAAWNYALDWASYRFEVVHRLVEPPPLQLIRSGRVLRANLRAEMLTVDDLKTKLREQGIEEIVHVKHAYMESDGTISVIRTDGRRPQGAG
jgi:uncharacterized membrane protein YcaP (DUF421 family)